MACDEDAVGPATTVTVTLQELCVGEVIVVGGGLVNCRHRCRKYSGHCGYPLVISPSPPPRARDQAGGVSVSRSVAGFPAFRAKTGGRLPGPVDELSTVARLACSDVVRGSRTVRRGSEGASGGPDTYSCVALRIPSM